MTYSGISKLMERMLCETSVLLVVSKAVFPSLKLHDIILQKQYFEQWSETLLDLVYDQL